MNTVAVVILFLALDTVKSQPIPGGFTYRASDFGKTYYADLSTGKKDLHTVIHLATYINYFKL